MKKSVYIDMTSDFGFKFCFKHEVVMRGFLNALLGREVNKITKIKYENVENQGGYLGERNAVFDICCTTEDGTRILVEMQKVAQRFFKTRAAYYTNALFNSQFKRGERWEDMTEDVSQVVSIFIIAGYDPCFSKVITRTSEFDVDERVESYDRIRKFFIYLPMFDEQDKGESNLNNWLYAIKYLGKMDRVDDDVYRNADEGLRLLIEKARVGALTEEEFYHYNASMKVIEDMVDFEKRGRMEGRKEGEINSKIAIARNMLEKGLAIPLVVSCTGLTEEEVKKIVSEM